MPENQSIDHRELARRANDRLAVYNPTNEDFKVYWDAYAHTVPARDRDLGYGPGLQVLPRYIAENYFTKMIDKLITEQADKAVLSENDERVTKRKQKKMDPDEVYNFSRHLMPDNETLRREMLTALFKGVVEEYGSEMMPEIEALKPRDSRPLDQQIIEELERPFTLPQSPVKLSPQEEAAREIAA